MENALPWFRPLSAARWCDLVLPKEHGSWSLAGEPLALGLLIAPTPAGGALAVAIAAAFLARRPLRAALTDARAERRHEASRALTPLVAIGAPAFAGAVALAGTSWLVYLVPAAITGAVFLRFDLRKAGREEVAEVAGSAAFATLPAAFLALAGASPWMCGAAALVMCGRAVPTVLCVRAKLRAMKTGVRRNAPALIAAAVALVVGGALVRVNLAPWLAGVLLALLAVRAVALLVFPRPTIRARTLGIAEAVAGLVFVIVVGATWNG